MKRFLCSALFPWLIILWTLGLMVENQTKYNARIRLRFYCEDNVVMPGAWTVDEQQVFTGDVMTLESLPQGGMEVGFMVR